MCVRYILVALKCVWKAIVNVFSLGRLSLAEYELSIAYKHDIKTFLFVASVSSWMSNNRRPLLVYVEKINGNQWCIKQIDFGAFVWYSANIINPFFSCLVWAIKFVYRFYCLWLWGFIICEHNIFQNQKAYQSEQYFKLILRSFVSLSSKLPPSYKQNQYSQSLNNVITQFHPIG